MSFQIVRPRTIRPARAWMTAVAMFALVMTGCAATSAPSSPTAAEATPEPSVAASPTETEPAAIDLDIDACAILDIATVQQLTGVSTDYTTSSSSGPSETKCFWGATTPGFPGYVELRIFRQTSLSAYSFGEGCSVTPVEGVGVEAAFVDCPANPQVKVSLLAFDRGVIVSLLVNEPASPLTAEDLSPVVESVFEQLR